MNIDYSSLFFPQPSLLMQRISNCLNQTRLKRIYVFLAEVLVDLFAEFSLHSEVLDRCQLKLDQFFINFRLSIHPAQIENEN